MVVVLERGQFHSSQEGTVLLFRRYYSSTDHVDVCGLTATGGWMRKGLGTVESVEGKLTWTFTAPHLGYWMAAPLSSTGGKRSL